MDMDYDIHVSTIEGQKDSFNRLKGQADELKSACDSLPISGDMADLKTSVVGVADRIVNGYSNYKNWLDGYMSELETTEGNIGKFEAPELKGNFENIFTKVLVPAIKSGASKEDKEAIQELGKLGTIVAGCRLKYGSTVLDTSRPVGTGEKYKLSPDELAFLGYVAMREQGTIEGARLELSLMANLYEQNKVSYSNVTDYVRNSGWFAINSMAGYSYPGDAYYKAAEDVLNNGNRYVASNVVEHDCLSDLVYSSTGNVYDTNSYIPGVTVLSNRYGATYTFVGFAPDGGDPFGYK